jgi:hypothetical protein
MERILKSTKVMYKRLEQQRLTAFTANALPSRTIRTARKPKVKTKAKTAGRIR